MEPNRLNAFMSINLLCRVLAWLSLIWLKQSRHIQIKCRDYIKE